MRNRQALGHMSVQDRMLYRVFNNMPQGLLEKAYPKVLAKLDAQLGSNIQSVWRRVAAGEMPDVPCSDGSVLSAKELFKLAFLSGLRYPRGPRDFRSDYGLIEPFKMRGFVSFFRDRVEEANRKGIPLVARCFPSELAYAAGAMPVDIVYFFNECVFTGDWTYFDKGQQLTSFESCPGEPAMAAFIEDGVLSVDLVVVGCNLLFGDAPCSHSLHRSLSKVPTVFIDWPCDGADKPYAVQYLAEQFLDVTQRIGALSGRKVSSDDMSEAIARANQARRFYREFFDILSRAETPPMAMLEQIIVTSPTIEWLGDPVAVANIMKDVNRELRQRVANGGKPNWVQKNPVRLFGASRLTFQPIFEVIEDLGGILMGSEILLAGFAADVDETGDPYEALAKWCLQKWPFSPSLRPEDRVTWLIDVLNQAKVEGLIFFGVWGCNWDPPLHHFIMDSVKEQIGIPSLSLTTAMPPRAPDGHYVVDGALRTRVEAFVEMVRARRRPTTVSTY